MLNVKREKSKIVVFGGNELSYCFTVLINMWKLYMILDDKVQVLYIDWYSTTK